MAVDLPLYSCGQWWSPLSPLSPLSVPLASLVTRHLIIIKANNPTVPSAPMANLRGIWIRSLCSPHRGLSTAHVHDMIVSVRQAGSANGYPQKWPSSSFGGWRATLLSNLHCFLEDFWWDWAHRRKNPPFTSHHWLLTCVVLPLITESIPLDPTLSLLILDHLSRYSGLKT